MKNIAKKLRNFNRNQNKDKKQTKNFKIIGRFFDEDEIEVLNKTGD